MRVFAMYFNEGANKVEAVKKGFSWPAFFFSWIWAFIKGLAGIGFALLAWAIVSNLISYAIEDESASIFFGLLAIGVAIFVGFQGNKWRENNLSKKGFEYKEDIPSNSPEDAISEFIKSKNQKKEEKEEE